jgi:hypothetical protein
VDLQREKRRGSISMSQGPACPAPESRSPYRAITDNAGQRPVSRAGMVAIMTLRTFGALTLGWIAYVHLIRLN